MPAPAAISATPTSPPGPTAPRPPTLPSRHGTRSRRGGGMGTTPRSSVPGSITEAFRLASAGDVGDRPLVVGDGADEVGHLLELLDVGDRLAHRRVVLGGGHDLHQRRDLALVGDLHGPLEG